MHWLKRYLVKRQKSLRLTFMPTLMLSWYPDQQERPDWRNNSRWAPWDSSMKSFRVVSSNELNIGIPTQLSLPCPICNLIEHVDKCMQLIGTQQLFTYSQIRFFFFFFQKQEHEKQASKKILENLTICLCMKISKDKHNYLERLSDENYELYWSNNIFPSV